jgi:hypothetical protein
MFRAINESKQLNLPAFLSACASGVEKTISVSPLDGRQSAAA